MSMSAETVLEPPVESRAAAYAAWVRELRSGKPVPKLESDAIDPLSVLARELELLAEQIARREREVERLFDLVHRLEEGVLLDDVLDRIFERFGEVIPYHRIGCAFVTPDGTHLSAFWARSLLGPMRISAGYAQPLAGSSLAAVLASGEPRIINDLEAHLAENPHSDATRRIVEEGGRSSLTCPLIVGRRPIGVLFFTSRDRGAYHDLHRTTFRQIAAQVSLVIEKSRLYEEMLDHNRRLQEERHRLSEAAAHDPLTGALNRGAIMGAVEQVVRAAAATRQPFGLVMVDIDHFKRVNDEHGHAAGDAVLIEFTRRMASALREGDLVGRYGGEEFLLLLRPLAADALGTTMERLRATVAERPFDLRGEPWRVTASFGAIVGPVGGTTAADLVARADQALYVAKRSGRDRVEIAAPAG